MIQVEFVRWSVTAADRKPLSVDPTNVSSTEWFGDAYTAMGEEFPAATRIVMKSKKEYLVQGSAREVVNKLNGAQGYIRFGRESDAA